jgi:regulatory protein
MPTGTITALTVQANDEERISVFIDGEFAIGVSLRVAQDLRLHKGQELTQGDWDQLERAERGSKAWNAALRLLAVRPRSEHELRDRLRRKEFEPEHIDTTITRLRELELIDDAHFAELWISNRQKLRPRGAQALRQELRAKGIDRDTVDEVVTNAVDAHDERAACEQVARQALRRYADAPDKATFLRKLGGLLQRRGFRFDTIKPIVDQLWRETKGID